MPVVEVQGVSKTFDEVNYVLRDVSFDLGPKTVTVLIGRSGSGKTTLLNLLAGLERPTSGRVRVDGVDLGGLDEEGLTDLRLRRIGIVFQRFHLIPELTVFENVRLPLQIARSKEANERTAHLLSFFGIGALRDAFPATLSGGEAQRTAVARALANRPGVLLADEPTANLDDRNAAVTLKELRRIADELGTAVLVASHDNQTRAIGDRVLELRQGRLGPAPPLTPRPAPSAPEAPPPAPRPPTPGTPGSRSSP